MGAFTEPRLLTQTMLHPRNPEYPTTTLRGLRFPFFVIKFKAAAGGTRGDLWVATNQCARRADNLSYCNAVDNNLAKLYISWKEDNLSYYL